ncbi:DoxX family protein [Tolumonas lignilytica]|uniref:DoxX family protein n=1 Tax=Tolumonas lignilytica TaxID=1283284 RepID=UPI0004B2760B|nr:DoxX family protein [Tolumonas lignilytica]
MKMTAWVTKGMQMLSKIPDSLIALLARFALAVIFWQSGQTKVDGLVVDLLSGKVQLGWPHLTDSARYLFREEYRLPLIPPDTAAYLAATAEHLFPVLLCLGLATRFSALALLSMTMVIQIFVYPDAYPTHAVWSVAFLFLLAKGAGPWSLDHWLMQSNRT